MSSKDEKKYKLLVEEESDKDFLSKTLITTKDNNEINENNVSNSFPDIETNEKENVNSASYLQRNEPNEILPDDFFTRKHTKEELEDISGDEAINGIFDKEKFKEICILALPISLFFSCLFLQQTINLIFIGNTESSIEKEDALNGIGFTHIYINCGCISIIAGLISGFETLGANAYGAKKYRLLGLYFQRSQLISYILVTIFLIIHYLFALDIFQAIGVNENTLKYISRYLPICLIFCFLDVQFSLNFRYLNIIEKSHYNLLFLIITLLLHPLWCYIFIIRLELSVEGAAISLVISQLINVLMANFYIYIIKPLPESIFMFYKSSFKGWWSYLKISIPSAFLMCAEWWAWEILAVLAGTISKEDFTVHLIAINISINIAVIQIGFGMAITILAGREFGKCKIKTALQYFKISAFFSNAIMLVIGSTIFIFRRTIFENFAHEPKLTDKSENILKLLSFVLFFDLNQYLFTSFYRGIGKIMFATALTFSNYYFFQVGGSLVLTQLFGYDVFGIWLAVLLASITATCINSGVFIKINLNKVLYETQKRLKEDGKTASQQF